MKILSKNKGLVAAISLLVTIIVISCSKSDTGSNPPDCSGAPKTFSGDVNPIIQTFCNQAACHNPGSTNGPGSLTNYSEVFGARSNIRAAVQSGLMPQNTTLTSAQKNAIICWIDSGAPNN